MGFPVIYEILGKPEDWNRDDRFVFVSKRVLINVIGLMLGGSVSLMNSLAEAEKKNMKGKVQVIYINLPAVIEFGSKSLSRVAHLRDRLVMARELLTETGSIFVQISNKNVYLVQRLLNEIFGSENFIRPDQIKALLNHLLKTELKGASRESLKLFGDLFDFVLCYAKLKGDQR